jgi:flagellar motor switch/type III secretory pathway protein FliN
MGDTDQLAHLADVTVELRAEIERRPVRLRDLLLLRPGSVLKTGRAATDRVELLVGECRIGTAEITQANGKTFARILDLSPRE